MGITYSHAGLLLLLLLAVAATGCDKSKESSACEEYTGLDFGPYPSMDSVALASQVVGSWYRVADVQDYGGSDRVECAQYTRANSPQSFEIHNDWTYTASTDSTSSSGTWYIEASYFGMPDSNGVMADTDELLGYWVRTDDRVELPVSYGEHGLARTGYGQADGIDFSYLFYSVNTRE